LVIFDLVIIFGYFWLFLVLAIRLTTACFIHRWDAVKAEGLHLELEVIFGVTHFNNVRSLRFWHGLCGVEDDAEGAEEARVWEEYERTMDAETFAFWRDERLDLATSAALADVDGDGVHLMPVTEEGYAGVARLADTIQALASARSS
jgi:5,10-methylenetetrahydrofolate reductase